MSEWKKQSEPNWFLAGLLAWLIPGAGHFYVGRRIRGVVLFVAVTATFWAGMAIGGTMTVDSHYERWWFLAQSLTGVNGLAGWAMQNRVYNKLAEDGMGNAGPTSDGRPGQTQMLIDRELRNRPGGSIVLAGPSGDVARAYSGIAGMLNLLCIFDAIMLVLMGHYKEPTLAGETA